MPWTDYPWVDTSAGGTPILASVLKSEFARVARDIPYESILRYGAVSGDSVDCTAAVQAAANALAGTKGRVYAPAGVYRMTGQVTYPPGVSFDGDGQDATIFHWATDLGAGQWALRNSAADSVYGMNTFSGIYLMGPSANTALTMGTSATAMRGLRLVRRSKVIDFRGQGFNMGHGHAGDHNTVISSYFKNNHYNAGWITTSGVQQWSDHRYYDTDLSEASMANIEVEESNFIDSSSFIGCHLGYAPYCIHTPAGRTETRFLANTTFFDCDPEQFGNAIIYGSDADDAITNVTWINPGRSSQSATFKITGAPYDHIVQAGTIIGLVIDSEQFVPSTAPAGAYIYSTGNLIRYVRVRSMSEAMMAALQVGRPFLQRADGGAATLCTWVGSGAAGDFRRTGAGAVTAGQLLRHDGRDSCLIYPTAGGVAPCGFAGHAAGAQEHVAVINSGYLDTAIAGAAIAESKFLKPSAAVAGRVLEATTFADGPIVGVSEGTAAGAASAFRVKATIGGPQG